jgi:hypothetical protein
MLQLYFNDSSECYIILYSSMTLVIPYFGFQLQVAIGTTWQDFKNWRYKKRKGPNPLNYQKN